jgi:hypothetical protein
VTRDCHAGICGSRKGRPLRRPDNMPDLGFGYALTRDQITITKNGAPGFRFSICQESVDRQLYGQSPHATLRQ